MKKKTIYTVVAVGVGILWFKSSVAGAVKKVGEVGGDAVEATTSKAIRWSSPLLYKDVYEYLKYKVTGEEPEKPIQHTGQRARADAQNFTTQNNQSISE